MSEKKGLVFYHADGSDGVGAAWAAWKVLQDTADYVPIKYSDPIPPREMVEGKVVYILDFSFKPAALQAAWDSAPLRVITLDHHKSMAENYDGWGVSRRVIGSGWYKEKRLNNCLYSARYEPDHSGAVMAWGYFHLSDAPLLLQYVEDRDLWKWDLPASKEINAYIQILSKNFATWDGLNVALTKMPERVVGYGRVVLEHQQTLIEQAARQVIFGTLYDVPVAICNSSVLHSEIGDHLHGLYPERVAVIWHQGPGSEKLSFRSRGDANAKALAEMFGGGGHQHAAGAYHSGFITGMIQFKPQI